MPNNSPATMATISSDKKGLSFLAVKTICKPIANRRMSSGMAEFYEGSGCIFLF
jgi:hypothetical protein